MAKCSDDGLRHRHGDSAVSLAHGDVAIGFFEYDGLQPLFRPRWFAGLRTPRPAGRIPGLAFLEAVLLWRLAEANVVVVGASAQTGLTVVAHSAASRHGAPTG